VLAAGYRPSTVESEHRLIFSVLEIAVGIGIEGPTSVQFGSRNTERRSFLPSHITSVVLFDSDPDPDSDFEHVWREYGKKWIPPPSYGPYGLTWPGSIDSVASRYVLCFQR